MNRIVKVAGLVVLAAVAAIGIYQVMPSTRATRLCEQLIMDDLVAPATYRRVSSEVTKLDDRYSVDIEFDAENAMGAPIRNGAFCTVNKGLSWASGGINGGGI